MVLYQIIIILEEGFIKKWSNIFNSENDTEVAAGYVSNQFIKR